jgi:hypothetical protein
MTRMKRIKTKYRGVYYIMGHSSLGEPERVYYIRYRRDGREFEENVGRQFQNSMTAEKAARIRVECIEGKRLSRREFKEQKKGESPEYALRSQESIKEADRHRIVDEKWLLLMEPVTNVFCLIDSDLNVVKLNTSHLRFLSANKLEILEKGATSETPSKGKVDLDYETFIRIIETERIVFLGDFIFPAGSGEDSDTKIRMFKAIVFSNGIAKRNQPQGLPKESEATFQNFVETAYDLM